MRKALVLLVITACGDNGAPTMPLDEFLRGRHEAECIRLTRCGLFTSKAVCNAYFRRPSDAALVAAIDNNKIDYDGAAAVECVNALAAIGCDKTRRDARVTPEPCLRVLRGRLADGEQCAFNDECRSDVCKDIPNCTRDTCCYGTCAPASKAELEEACAGDEQCVEGAYCHKSKVCRARVAANGSCDDARGCDFGLACIGVTDLQPGTCRALPLVGESCPYMECAEISARCTADFVCVQLGLPGSPCMSDEECSEYARCDEAIATCVEIPALGEPCDLFCAGEAWCDAGTCSAPLANGAMCSADDQCESTDCFEGPVFDQCNATAVCY